MKIAVLTGATSGIGNSILKAFLEDGYTVWAGYRDIRQKKDLTSISENVIPFRIDLTKKWTIDDAVKTITSSVEKIDVLINAAGKVVAGPLENLPVSKIREQFEVNTFAHLEFTQGLFEKLDGGKVINISSMASYGIFPFLAPYCASKNALDMMFNSLRIETGLRVKIISVKPGVIATPLWTKAIDENKDNIGSGKYKIVADYLVSNAKENAEKGLDPRKVAQKVLKIANSENPKNSYTVGTDALLVKLFAKLPQKLVNVVVEHQLVKRVQSQLRNGMLTPETRAEEKMEEQTNFEPVSVDDSEVMEDENEDNPAAQFQSALEDAINSNRSHD